MIEVKFTIDEDFTESDLKQMMAYKDYQCVLWDLKMLVKDFWESSEPRTEENIDKFVNRFYEIANEVDDGM